MFEFLTNCFIFWITEDKNSQIILNLKQSWKLKQAHKFCTYSLFRVLGTIISNRLSQWLLVSKWEYQSAIFPEIIDRSWILICVGLSSCISQTINCIIRVINNVLEEPESSSYHSSENAASNVIWFFSWAVISSHLDVQSECSDEVLQICSYCIVSIKHPMGVLHCFSNFFIILILISTILPDSNWKCNQNKE
jgi:hypothetical protein